MSDRIGSPESGDHGVGGTFVSPGFGQLRFLKR
jgi:hypothetical protein